MSIHRYAVVIGAIGAVLGLGWTPVRAQAPPVVESEELPPLRVTMTAPSGPLNYLIDGKATIMNSVIAGEATLVIENRGTETGRLFWGQQVSSLFAGQDDPQRVARYTGPIEMWGRYTELKPGDTIGMTAFTTEPPALKPPVVATLMLPLGVLAPTL